MNDVIFAYCFICFTIGVFVGGFLLMPPIKRRDKEISMWMKEYKRKNEEIKQLKEESQG